MASLQKRNDSYRVLFPYHGKLHAFTIGRVSEHEALSKCRQVDYLLMRLKQRLIHLPPDTDIVEFVRFDGDPPETPKLPDSPRRIVTLGALRDRYVATLGNGTVEANSLATVRLHLKHFLTALGEARPIDEIKLATLQEYVDTRAKAKRSPTTVRKEIATLRAAWNWGGSMGLTSGMFPSKGLRYPKADEKSVFMTRREIKRRIAGVGDEALWDCLYLESNDVARFLAHVKKAAVNAWLYPALCFAAHTGARRSEVLRALVADIDFRASAVVIRERKRNRERRTQRRVPLTPLLRRVLQEWLREHPGGPHLFCHAAVVGRSKKRSFTTGHRGMKSRASTSVGRAATVRRREIFADSAITRDEFHDHFKRLIEGSEWSVMRGPHVLRHSFISACASKGVDQRLIDEWTGHSTDEQRRRYRHLYPSIQADAIRTVFA
ncbi:MAG: tyrosine-type recombinase/integrase [Gemmataceae bacterium]